MKVSKLNVRSGGVAVGVLVEIEPVFLYNIPKTSNGDNVHRASAWNISAPDWRGKLLVINTGAGTEASEDCCQVEFTNTDGVLFGVAVLTKIDFRSSRAFQKVRDSSRYCTQQIQNIVSGDSAVHGVGFLNREHISQLFHSLKDYFRPVYQNASSVIGNASIKCKVHAQVQTEVTDGLTEDLKYTHHNKAQVDMENETMTTADPTYIEHAPIKVEVEDETAKAPTNFKIEHERAHSPTYLKVAADDTAHAPIIMEETAHAPINLKVKDQTAHAPIIEDEPAHAPLSLKVEEETAHAPNNLVIEDETSFAPVNVQVDSETAHVQTNLEFEVETAHASINLKVKNEATHAPTTREVGDEATHAPNKVEVNNETETWTWMHFRDRDTKELTCPICPEPLTFPSKRRFAFLINHFKEAHHLSEPPTCRLCNVIFSTGDLRLEHILELHSLCPICSKEFISSRGLSSHLKFVHGSTLSDLTCPICFIELGKIKNVNRHLKRVDIFTSTPSVDVQIPPKTAKSTLTCPTCLREFGKKKNLNWHLKRAHNFTSTQSVGVTVEVSPKKAKTNLICSTCSKEFEEMAHLNNHVKRVHDPNSNSSPSVSNSAVIARKKSKLTCSTCSMKFGTWNKLYNHVKQVHNPKSTLSDSAIKMKTTE